MSKSKVKYHRIVVLAMKLCIWASTVTGSCICSTILTFHFLLASRLSFNSTFCIPEGWYELGLPTTFSVSSGFCFHSEKWNKPRVCSWWVIQENIAPPPHLGDQLKWRKMLFSNQRGGELCKFDNLQSQQMQSFSVFFLASHSHLALSWVSPLLKHLNNLFLSKIRGFQFLTSIHKSKFGQ